MERLDPSQYFTKYSHPAQPHLYALVYQSNHQTHSRLLEKRIRHNCMPIVPIAWPNSAPNALSEHQSDPRMTLIWKMLRPQTRRRLTQPWPTQN